MRSITEGEAVAIRALLASLPTSERRRIRETGLGSRTFERIRKRAYGSGWVFDRIIPDPSRTGFETIFLVMAQPFAEHLEGIQARWKELPSNVLLWRWPETVFGVFFSNESQEKFLAGLYLPAGRSETFVVSSPAKRHAIPVYFDFEAAWARLTLQRGTLAYPHALPAVAREDEAPSGKLSISREKIAGLLARPVRPGAENAPLHVSPFFFPRSYQHLLETGLVERRTILDPQKVPPFQGRSIERVAFVQGELTSPGTENTLFRMLMAIRVTPFLFASDGSRVLLATLSPAPADPEPLSGRPPAILGNLRRFLNGIQIVREPVEALSVVVNHRYDRLFPMAE
jgi:hypothetical protein